MRQSIALLACCGVLTITVGCSQNMGTVRGQTPGQFQPQTGYMPPGSQMASNGGFRMPGPSPEARYYDGPAYDPNQFGPADCPSCPQGSGCPVCPQGQGFDVWRPTHHHTWEYNAPKGLTYPDPNQAPAQVQYPYYTVKGPTDFFMK